MFGVWKNIEFLVEIKVIFEIKVYIHTFGPRITWLYGFIKTSRNTNLFITRFEVHTKFRFSFRKNNDVC